MITRQCKGREALVLLIDAPLHFAQLFYNSLPSYSRLFDLAGIVFSGVDIRIKPPCVNFNLLSLVFWS